eukprot:363852-Chlamydomonas_euryale.AAC.1
MELPTEVMTGDQGGFKSGGGLMQPPNDAWVEVAMHAPRPPQATRAISQIQKKERSVASMLQSMLAEPGLRSW